jgi:hypothetical protein
MWAGNELGMIRNESRKMEEAWKINFGWKLIRNGKEREGGNKGGLENSCGLEMKETKKMNED